MKNKKILIILILILLLILGLFLGGSITTFILFLNKHDDLLAILSYIFLSLFTLVTIIEFILYTLYQQHKNED